MSDEMKKPAKPLDYRGVDEAIAQGKLWRAKEILQGRIRGSAYDSILYERYGILLLKMGDTIEAGKFLFLSGNWKDEYKQAIELFGTRHMRDSFEFECCLPRMVAIVGYSCLPKNVEIEIQDLNPPTKKVPEFQRRIKAKHDASPNFLAGCGFAALIIITLMIIGIVKIVEWIK